MRTTDVYIEVSDETIAHSSVFGIIEPVWETVSIYDGIAEYEASLSAFSIQQRHVFAIQWYRAEVSNGAHFQFFYNSAGIVWQDAAEGLDAIGLPQAAAMLREAVSRLGTESRFRDERIAALDRNEPDFSGADEAFLELDRAGRFEDMAHAYIRAHASAFHFRGIVRRTLTDVDVDEVG